jgi:hypothetical protein
MVNVPQVQIPDFGASIMRGEQVQQSRLHAMAAQRALDEAARYDATLGEIAPALAAGEGPQYDGALARLAGAGRRGFETALPLLQERRQRREYDAWTGGGAPAATPAVAGGAAPAATPAGANPQWEDRNLPRGIRNNNPLNLTFVAGQPGVQGSDGRFGRYNTPEDGVAAATRQLQLYGQRGLTTVEQIIGRWAPPNENNTANYVATVSRALGLAPNAPLDLSNPEVVSRLVGAMAQMENGRPLDQAVVQRGVMQALRPPQAAPADGATVPASNTIPAAGGAPTGAAPSRTGIDPAELRRIEQGLASPNPMIQRAAQARLQTLQFQMRDGNAEPLETVEGPDGRPVLLPRSQAVGRTPVRIPNTVVNNNPGETSFDRERGKTLAERASDWEAASTRSAQTLGRLQRFEALNQQFTTGAGANISLTAGQVAQRLGIPDAVLGTLGIARDQVAAGEGLRSLTSQMLVGLLGSGGFPSNNFSNADRDMLERALPALANSPNGNAVIINILRASAERDRTIGAAWREWTAQNGESAESVRRFQADRLPALTGQDILTPILQDAVPADNPTTPGPGGRGTAAPPPAAPAARPRARNAQGQVIEYNGTAWVPVQ